MHDTGSFDIFKAHCVFNAKIQHAIIMWLNVLFIFLLKFILNCAFCRYILNGRMTKFPRKM